MRLKDKTAIVTGAGSGIGRAIAVRFANEGATVVVAELNAESGEETAAMLREQNHEAISVTTDVSNSDDVRKLFDEIDRRQWNVDILVNNAGNAGGELQPIEELTDEQWDTTVDVHLGGTFRCCREALKRMKPREQGIIINFGSVAGLRGLPGSSPYTAAKGAIISLSKSLSHEVAADGIRVNCIAPGWIDTPILDNLPEKWRPRMIKDTPLGRLGTPEDIAGVAMFLSTDDSAFVTGQVISPNGGMYR